MSDVDPDRLAQAGCSVGMSALRCYLVWLAMFGGSGIRDGSPWIGLVIAGCMALVLAFVGSLVLLLVREVRG